MRGTLYAPGRAFWALQKLGAKMNGKYCTLSKHRESQAPRAVDQTTPQDQPAVVVEIFVTPDCANCAYANEVAAQMREEFPTVEVRMITVGAPGVIVPESVFATPTYLLNGQRWSLGNPGPQEVRATLRAALARG